MGFEWLEAGLPALRGIETYEVVRVLSSQRRWPRPAVGPDGHPVLMIWGAPRRAGRWSW